MKQKNKKVLAFSYAIVVATLLFANCKKKESESNLVITPASLSYIATLSLGKVSLADKTVKSGEVFSDKPKLQVADASMLDVQVKGLASDVIIRVKGGTDIQFYSRKKNEILEFIVFIKKGKAIFNIDKLNKNEAVIVYTPISRNQVRGTLFDVVVNNLGDTSLHTGNGSVESAFTNLALDVMTETDLLPPDARRVIGGIRAVNTIIESGNELNITSGDAEKVLRGLGLDEVANSPEFKTAGFFMDARLDEKNAANVLLEYSKGFMSKDQKQILESTQQIANALQLKNTADVQTLIKEANEIVRIGLKENSSDEEIKKAVEEKIRANKDSLQTTVERVYGKGSETIILRNGTKIRGVLDQRGNTFILKTAEGEVEFPGSQVKGYAF